MISLLLVVGYLIGGIVMFVTAARYYHSTEPDNKAGNAFASLVVALLWPLALAAVVCGHTVVWAFERATRNG